MSNLVIRDGLPKYKEWELNSLLPYGDNAEQAAEAIKCFNAKTPNIISKDMGLSTCPDCGAVYSGSQEKCNQIVDKHQIAWYGKKHGYNPLKHDSSGHAVANFREECGSFCKWGLKQEFNFQADYFRFLINAYSMLKSTNQFAHMFENEQGFNLAQLSVLNSKSMMIDITLNSQDTFNRQLVDRMNSAGASLYWGGR
jgi:hypothetical protein